MSEIAESRGKRLPLILMALVVAEITSGFELAMSYAALPTLIRHFGDPVDVGWVITANLLVGAGMAGIAGRLGDLYGRRRVILIALAVAACGSAISALSSTLELIIAGRAVQGVVGAIMPLCFGLLRESVPPRLMSLGVGIITSSASLSITAGLLVGGALIDNADWHSVFAAGAAMAVISFAAVILFVPPSRRSEGRVSLDLAGGGMFFIGICGLLLLVSKAQQLVWNDPATWLLLALSLAALAGWIRRSLGHPHPMIDIRLFQRREVLIANICMVLIATGTLQTTQFLTLLMQQPRWTGVGLGVSAGWAATYLLPANMASILGAPLSGYLVGRLGGRAVMVGGSLLLIGTWLLLALDHSHLATVVTLGAISNLGMIAIYTAMFALMVATVPASRTSEVTGMLAVVRATFMSVGAQMLVVVLASSTVQEAGSSVRLPSPASFTLAFSIVCALNMLLFVMALYLPKAGGVAGRPAETAA